MTKTRVPRSRETRGMYRWPRRFQCRRFAPPSRMWPPFAAEAENTGQKPGATKPVAPPFRAVEPCLAPLLPLPSRGRNPKDLRRHARKTSTHFQPCGSDSVTDLIDRKAFFIHGPPTGIPEPFGRRCAYPQSSERRCRYSGLMTTWLMAAPPEGTCIGAVACSLSAKPH
jgi:hypothetical protein